MNGTAWYEDDCIATADAYMAKYLSLRRDSDIRAQFNTYARFSEIRALFESNLMEGAGLPFGETKELLDTAFPAVPGTLAEFCSSGWVSNQIALKPVFDFDDEAAELRLRQLGIEMHREPYVRFGRDRSREMSEVLFHYLALRRAGVFQARYQLNRSRASLFNTLEAAVDSGSMTRRAARAMWKRLTFGDPYALPRRYNPISERNIKLLHRSLAGGEDELGDPHVKPGEYRHNDVHVNLEMVFPAPALIPQAMKAWSKSFAETRGSSIRRAAALSYRFVCIHPFADYNGRMSRIVMNMLLQGDGLPFSVVLRGTAKDRTRYMQSLRHADRHNNTERYAQLIGRGVVEGFRAVERQAMIAGLPPQLAITDEDIELRRERPAKESKMR